MWPGVRVESAPFGSAVGRNKMPSHAVQAFEGHRLVICLLISNEILGICILLRIEKRVNGCPYINRIGWYLAMAKGTAEAAGSDVHANYVLAEPVPALLSHNGRGHRAFTMVCVFIVHCVGQTCGLEGAIIAF